MVDEMPAQKRGKLDEGVPAEVCGTSGDCLSALPDALLHHVFSLLPAEEAVRTCVLAHRWRHLWKSAPGLRIGCLDDYEPVSVTTLRRFVDSLFLLRGLSPLDACELIIGDFNEDGDEERVNLWFRRAVVCKGLKLYVTENHLFLDNLPLVSKHLSRLELHLVYCHTRILDFSSCPVLKHLKFARCGLELATKVSSESLQSLSIIASSFPEEPGFQIYSPNLISLHLDDYIGSTPILDNMPLLVEAFVRVGGYVVDWCQKLAFGRQDCVCEYCDSGNVGNGDCVLLKGLAQAKTLALISIPEMFTFKWDLRWCPTFSNLKTLLLNDYWCVPDDHYALSYILQHAPNLEKLTLHLFSEGPNHKIEMKGSFNSMARSTAISEHLKIVEIKCEIVDERVFKVLKFLCTFNISFSC